MAFGWDEIRQIFRTRQPEDSEPHVAGPRGATGGQEARGPKGETGLLGVRGPTIVLSRGEWELLLELRKRLGTDTEADSIELRTMFENLEEGQNND